MKDLKFTHTITITEDDFITMEVYLNEHLEKSNDTFEEALDKAFLEMLDDFLYSDDSVMYAICEYHKDEILEKFKKWHKKLLTE